MTIKKIRQSKSKKRKDTYNANEIYEKLNLPYAPQKKINKTLFNMIIWKRVISFIIDILIIDIFLLSFYNSVFVKLFKTADISKALMLLQESDYILSMASIIIFLISLTIFFYFSFMEYIAGSTPGKMIFNMFVYGVKEKNITLLQAFIRNLWAVSLFPFFLIWIIDPLFMAFRSDNKRLLEILSNTCTKESYNQ